MTKPSKQEIARLNEGAKFHPADERGALPCIELPTGEQCYFYCDETGTLRTSIDLEGDGTLARPDGTVPIQVDLGDTALFADKRSG